MNEFSDERLMAFADGEMSPDEAALLEDAIARDPALQRRLETFHNTGRRLRHVFEVVEQVPVPQHLIDAVLRAPIAAAATAPRQAPAPSSGLADFVSQVRALFATPAGWAAVAATGVLVVAAGNALVGSRPTQDALGGGDLAAFNRVGSLAPASLARVLEAERGGQISQIATEAGKITVAPVMTFRSRDQQFCREYAAARGGDSEVRGVACRETVGWRIVAGSGPVSVQARDGGAVRPAEGKSFRAIDEAVDALIEGDVLTKEAEMRVIARGWKETN